MKESGCAQILIGLESPKRSTLDGVEQKANWKFNQAGRYTDAIQKIQDAGITVNGCFVLGLTMQTQRPSTTSGISSEEAACTRSRSP